MSAILVYGAFLFLVLFFYSFPGSWVLLHEFAEKSEVETKGKRRIFQENFLEEIVLIYDALQWDAEKWARVWGTS